MIDAYSDPLADLSATETVLAQVFEAAGPYLGSLTDRLVLDSAARPMLHELAGAGAGPAGDLPEHGMGSAEAVRRLLRIGTATATASAGPRFYHFVIGGVTPAALAADWITSLLDQNAGMRASSELAHELETIALDWLRQLLRLPVGWGGVLTSSATLANLTGLGAATYWWGERHGRDVAADGISGLPRMPVLASGLVHPSARKALQLLGHGNTVEVFAVDGVGRVDLTGLADRLAQLGDAPAVIVACAGEPNAGEFDPIADLADLAETHGAWLHVDGAFGAFAAVSPTTAHLVAGLERADSIAADAHKWLNVPYESGFALVREPHRLAQAFGMPGAPYLPDPGSPGSGYMMLGPESSRRARALPIWATLAAYGRGGHQAMIERHCALARHLADRVDAAPDLQRLADVPLNVVCFRYRPAELPASRLNEVNRSLGGHLLADGRVFAGTTVYDGQVALRPAVTNWRTTAADLDLLVEVVREIGAKCVAEDPLS
jgi:glutamate/tyrosine decarboxylase-like PLP-dependent enzyme